MEAQTDGTYKKVYTNVAVMNNYQFKIVENFADGTQNWIGIDGGNDNVIFNVVSVCDVTIIFDPETFKITVMGAGVEIPTELNVQSMRAVGNGDGNWLNSVSWDPASDENLMTEVSPKVYEITYTDLGEFDNYQVKFAANGSWADNWGGAYQGSGVESDAEYNSNNNIIIEVPCELADVTLRLDLTNFDYATKQGAKFTVKVVDKTSTSSETTEISSVAITDIETPAANTALDTSASCATTGVSSTTPSVTWTPNDSTAGYNISYTASITLTAGTGYKFADAVTATVSGNNATSVKKNDDGTLTVTYAFPEITDTVITKLPPEIIKGAGQSTTEGESKALSFTSNAAFSDFIRVELDGKPLDEKNYTVNEGSTVVTLKADYVATLSVGKHTIGIVSENGTATTTFTVIVKAAVNEDNAKPGVDNDTADGNKESPHTGDNSHMVFGIALLFAIGAGAIGTTVYGKKRRAK